MLIWCGFVSVVGRIKFGGEPFEDIELDTDDVSGFGLGLVIEVETAICDEMSLAEAGLFPHFGEPGDALLPVEECLERWEVGMFAEDMRDGFVAFGEDIAEALCEGFGELGGFVALWEVGRAGARFEGAQVRNYRWKLSIHG